MLTKSSEENVFCHQIVTFSEDIKNLSQKVITIGDETSFRHCRSWKKLVPMKFLGADVYGNEIFCHTKWNLG